MNRRDATSSVWDRRAAHEKKQGPITELFELPLREKQTWRNPLADWYASLSFVGHLRLLSTAQTDPSGISKKRWQSLSDESMAISALCEAELLYGLELKGSPKLTKLYESLLNNRFQIFGRSGNC
jgi:hypothetical protein